MSHCGIKKRNAFTLTEVLLSVLIVGILAALIIPAIVTSYQTKALDEAFKRETQTIEQSIKSLTVNENKTSFFDTIMYSTSTDYDNTAGKYLKKYLRISKYCGTNNGNCFATKYYEYKDHDKKEYKPNYKGACASLKNGMSLCLTPQVGGASIEGLIDLNGSKGPNVVGRDLRTFTISPQIQTAINKGQFEAVRSTDYLVESLDPCAGLTCGCGTLPACNPCDTDPNGLACCQTKTITSSSDVCCAYSSIKYATTTLNGESGSPKNLACFTPTITLSATCSIMDGTTFCVSPGIVDSELPPGMEIEAAFKIGAYGLSGGVLHCYMDGFGINTIAHSGDNVVPGTHERPFPGIYEFGLTSENDKGDRINHVTVTRYISGYSSKVIYDQDIEPTEHYNSPIVIPISDLY